MNLNVSGHHLEVTPAIRSYVKSKLERVTRHFDHVIDAHVILTVEKLLPEGRGRRCTCAARTCTARARKQDLYAAIDLLADKLDRQVLALQGQARTTKE